VELHLVRVIFKLLLFCKVLCRSSLEYRFGGGERFFFWGGEGAKYEYSFNSKRDTETFENFAIYFY
jgi:hypothetical protein